MERGCAEAGGVEDGAGGAGKGGEDAAGVMKAAGGGRRKGMVASMVGGLVAAAGCGRDGFPGGADG